MTGPKSQLPLLAVIAACLASAWPAAAAVQEAKEGSFTNQSAVLVDVSPESAYKALRRVAAWWDPAHTWSGSAQNLSLDARAGGCFCERLAQGGTVQHARVLFAQPGKLLRMEGALGPLQEMAVTGILTFGLAPDGKGTRITMTYRVAGGLTMDGTKLAPLVDQVMTGQLERLRTYANSGAGR